MGLRHPAKRILFQQGQTAGLYETDANIGEDILPSRSVSSMSADLL